MLAAYQADGFRALDGSNSGRFVRLARIKELMEENHIDDTLRWREPVSA